MLKNHTRLDLVEGGNIIKQGDQITLAFYARDYKGEILDLTDKTIAGQIYSRQRGIVYEAAASYDAATQKIFFTITELLDTGSFQIEFTITDAGDADYRLKVPSDSSDGRLTINASGDNMDYVGVSMTTVSQLRNEQQALQTEFANEVLPRVNTVEGRQDELEEIVQAGVGAFTEDTEVVTARMGEPSLLAYNQKTTALLAETLKKTDTGVLSLNAFTEEDRAVILGMVEGEINAVLGDGNVKPENTSFIEVIKSLNGFNKDSADNVQSFYVNTVTGAPVSRSAYLYSHLIPIEVGETRTYPIDTLTFGSNANRLPVYDANGVFLASEVGTASTDNLFNTITFTSENARFTKVNVKKTDINTFMFARGTSYPAQFEAFKPTTYKLKENISLNVTPELNNEKNPLVNKIAVFDGDSISNGASAADGLSGWAGRIGPKNSMTWQNYSISGATITAGTRSSDGLNDRHWVSRNVANLRADADYIILEGGTNDADLLGVANLGTISTGFNAVLDDTTFSGAVESTLKQAILKYKGKKIGFVIAHKMGSMSQQAIRKAFFDRIMEICRKWGVPYINLWETSYLNPELLDLKTIYYSDNQHLRSAGYDHITPLIEKWMKTL